MKAYKTVGKKIIAGNQGADEVRSDGGFCFCLPASAYSICAQRKKLNRQSNVTDYYDFSSPSSIFGKQQQYLVHTYLHKSVFSLSTLHLFYSHPLTSGSIHPTQTLAGIILA